MNTPIAVTIAGSDSSGGAGIQADLKTFAAHGVYGASAITAVTAQDTTQVSDIVELSPAIVRAQIDRVAEDLVPAAAKTGMLSSPAIIEAVAEAIRDHGLTHLVVDPVMVAKGGARLLREEAVDTVRRRLLPLAEVLTPNLPEAEVLLGHPVATMEERRRASAELVELGCRAVVLKGGHSGDALDLYYDGARMVEMAGRWVDTSNTHGSGCCFSAAIAAGLARGLGAEDAVSAAKEFIQSAVEHALELGRGHGPVNPLFAFTEGAP